MSVTLRYVPVPNNMPQRGDPNEKITRMLMALMSTQMIGFNRNLGSARLKCIIISLSLIGVPP